MKVNRLSVEYENEVVEFLQFAEINLSDNNEIFIVLLFLWEYEKK